MGELVEKIRYEIDESDVVRGHEQMQRAADETARESEQASKKADGAWSKFATGLERNAGKMKAIGAGMTVALTAPLAMFGNASIDAAADATESASKARAVFGQWADDIEDWAGTASESLRMGRTEALEAAGTFGNLFTAMEIDRQAAADMSKQVVQLAADLASFNNIGADEALEKLRSGLVGEIEPLRALGVSFNAATVEAKALEMGLADANGEVTEAAKVQARLALVMEMTTNAQGDAAKTAGTLVGQQAELDAKSEELQETIGERLVPAKLALVEAANGVLSSFMALPGPAQDVAVGVGAVTAAAGPALLAVGQMATGIGALREALPGLKDRFSGVASVLKGPWGAAMAGGVVALGAFAQAKMEQKARIEEVIATLDEETGALTENTESWAANELTSSGAFKHAETLGLAKGDLIGFLKGEEDATRRVNDALDTHLGTMGPAADAAFKLTGVLRERNHELDAAQEDWRAENEALAEAKGRYLDVQHAIESGLTPAEASLRVELQGVKAAQDAANDAMGETPGAADPAAESVDTLAEKSGIAAGQVRTLKEALDAQRTAMMALVDPLFAAVNSEQNLAEAKAATQEALEKFGSSSSEYERALLDQARAAAVYDQDLAGLLESVRNGEGDVGQLRAAMSRLHDQDMVDEEAVEALFAALEEALGLAERINGTEAVLRIRTVRVDPDLGTVVGYGAGRGGIPERALGGPVADGRPYLVGEEGPELFVPDGSGTIIPNDQSMRYLERIMMATERSATRSPFVPFAVDGSDDTMATLRLGQMAFD